MNISALAVIVVVLALIVKAAATPVHYVKDQDQIRRYGPYEADAPEQRDEGRFTILIIMLALLLLALVTK